MTMSTVELLTELSASGVSLRRLPGDRIEVKGPLDERLKQSLQEHKRELLSVLPDPADEFRRIWSDAIAQGNQHLSGVWFGTADQWDTLDEIETRFQAAVEAGDVAQAKAAAQEFVETCILFRLRDEAIHAFN
jgi:hypothetical protein